MRYYIKTFGCQQNEADSERIVAACEDKGMTPAQSYEDASYVVINTCMVRGSAEERVYGLVYNLAPIKQAKQSQGQPYKIIVTGCMVGLAHRDITGRYLAKIRERMPAVDEFMPIEEVGFDHQPVHTHGTTAYVPISNGCNNFCTFCVVPFTRGREISRSFQDIIAECQTLRKQGIAQLLLLGQNVNSYGADLVQGTSNQHMRDIATTYFATIKSSTPCHHLKPVYVTHLGRQRIPTLFPHLLEAIAHMGFDHIDFMSSNPWDFSDELIEVIARNANITRTLHLPIQSGDNTMLKKMNRWHTQEDYLALVNKIRTRIPDVQFTTDVVVGFCGETDEQFEQTVSIAKKVGFAKAYIGRYSPRPNTSATKIMSDDVPPAVKKQRWRVLNELINEKSRTS